MAREITHVVALIDTSKTPLCEGHMIKSRAVEAHIVVIAAIRQIQKLEPTVTFTNIIGE